MEQKDVRVLAIELARSIGQVQVLLEAAIDQENWDLAQRAYKILEEL